VTAPFPVRFATVPVHEVPLPVRVTDGVPAPLNVTTGATDRLSPDVTLIVTGVPDLNGPLADPFLNVTALAIGAEVSTAYVSDVDAVRTVRALPAVSVIDTSVARPSPRVPFEADIPVRETVTVYADPDPLMPETVGVPVTSVVETAKSAVPTPITSSENVTRKRAVVVREFRDEPSSRVMEVTVGRMPSTEIAALDARSASVLGSVRMAAFPAASVIDPPLRESELVST